VDGKIISTNRLQQSGVDLTVNIIQKGDVPSALDFLMVLMNTAMVNAANRVIVPELQKVLSIQGPPRSAPFEAPHRDAPEDQMKNYARTGLMPLMESVGAWMCDAGGIAIGSSDKYGLYLEIGTQTMAPRPWLVPTLTRPDVMASFQEAVAEEFEKMVALLDQESISEGRIPTLSTGGTTDSVPGPT
jgi:hypothetical protein